MYYIAKVSIILGMLSALIIAIDIKNNPQKDIPLMNIVLPIN